MSISGNLRTMPFPDLLQWIALSKKTGALIVKGARYTKKLLFSDGNVTAVTSNNPTEHLGHYLIGWRYLSEEQLRSLLERQRQTRSMLGELLASEGALTRDQVAHLLRVKTEETIFDLMLWEEGEFFFLDDASPARTYQELNLPVDQIIFEGARRVDERRRMKEVIPNGLVAARLLDSSGEIARNETEREMLAFMDGNHTLDAIALQVRAARFDVQSLAFRLLSAGKVEIVSAGIRPQAGPQPETWRALVAEAEGRLSIGALLEAYQCCREVRSRFASDPVALQAVAGLVTRIEDEFQLNPLKGEVILEMALSLDQVMNLNCAPEEGFVLSRINGHFTLPQILAQLPGDRLHNLLVMHSLLRRGIIRVQRTRAVSKFQV